MAQDGIDRETVQKLVDQLMAQGGDPRSLVSDVLQAASARSGFWPPEPEQPTLPPPPDTVACYRVRVDLDGTKPPVWRRLELAGDLTLERLHQVLQTAMGWTDSHLHNFSTTPARDFSVAPFLTDFDEEEGDEGVNERDVRLDQTLRAVGDRLYYEYDFGDGWGHTIKLEAIGDFDPESPAARLIAGRRACPPEDCGGVGGYHEILDLLDHEGPTDDHQQLILDWLPLDYDPAEFSVEPPTSSSS